MSTSVKAQSVNMFEEKSPSHGKAALHYAIAAGACVFFALVYAQFSHGVYSPFMTFMFAIPLVGGVLPALGLSLAKARPAPRIARQAWALAIASLTIASCLQGIFEIAGTGSPYLAAYLVIAIVLAVVALASHLTTSRRPHRVE